MKMLKIFNIFDDKQDGDETSERVKLNLGRLVFIATLVLGYLFFMSASRYKTIADELVKLRADVTVIKEAVTVQRADTDNEQE